MRHSPLSRSFSNRLGLFLFLICNLRTTASFQLGKSKLGKLDIFHANKLQMSIGSLLTSATAVAGVVAFHEAGHFLAARLQGMKIQSVNVGYGPKLLSFNDTSDIEYAFRAIPFGGYVAFPSNVEVDDSGQIIKELDDPNLLQNRPPIQRLLVISAGVFANLLLTLLLASGTAITSGISHPIFASGVSVSVDPSPSTPASIAGLQARDIITRVNMKQISSNEMAVDDFISEIRKNPGKRLELQIIRNQKEFTGFVVPELTGGRSSIGLSVSRHMIDNSIETAKNPLDAMKIGADETVRLTRATWNAFCRAVSTGFSGNDIGGPISLVKNGAQLAENTPNAIVGFAATVSINLAVLNSLPFPALDGGQFVFVLVELLTGRPLNRDLKEALIGTAFVALLVVGVTTFVGDLMKLSQ